jgi:hypothetical protein
MLNRLKEAPVLSEPKEKDARTLWVGNLDETIGSEDLRYVCRRVGVRVSACMVVVVTAVALLAAR